MNKQNIEKLITDLQKLADEIGYSAIDEETIEDYNKGLERKFYITPQMKKCLVELKKQGKESSYEKACFNAMQYYLTQKYGYGLGCN